MHDMAKYLPPPSSNGDILNQANWKVCDRGFTKDYIRVTTKDGILTPMQYVMDEKYVEYCYLTHEYWCELSSTLEAKDSRNRAADQIKRLSIQKAVTVDSDSGSIPRVPRKKKSINGMFPYRKQNKSNTPKYGVI